MTSHLTPKSTLHRAASMALHAAVSAAALCAIAPAAAAQNKDQPIRLIVASQPGSAPDVFARVLADGMTSELDQQVLVENRAGANGNIAAQAVLQQPADGNTLWVGTQSMVEINPSAFATMPWAPEDFKAIIKGVEAPMVLAVNHGVEADDFAGLLEWLKRERGNISYASFSAGTPSHFLGYQLSERFDLDMVHVPYRGSGPQITDLMGGHALLGFTQMQTALPALEAGKIKALATTGSERARQLPDVPTLHELGMPEFDTTVWFGLFANSKTPDARIAELTSAAARVLEQPDYREKLENIGFEVSGQTGEPFEQAITEQRARWAQVVKATGFSAAE